MLRFSCCEGFPGFALPGVGFAFAETTTVEVPAGVTGVGWVGAVLLWPPQLVRTTVRKIAGKNRSAFRRFREVALISRMPKPSMPEYFHPVYVPEPAGSCG